MWFGAYMNYNMYERKKERERDGRGRKWEGRVWLTRIFP
jgi:hypothetical protein